ncbi:MAG: invasion associated locus B family protein, partial [Pseudomonadota bacterium]
MNTIARTTKYLSILSLLIASLSAGAQQISDLEDSVSAPAPQAQGQSDLQVTQVGDWNVVCEAGGAPPCAMTQLGKDPQGSPAIEFVVRKVDDESAVIEGIKVEAVADIVTPLGVLLEFGLRMKIDEKEERGAPFRICQKHGCLVREPLSVEVIEALKKGNTALITVAAEGAGPIDIPISLSGLTKA